MNRNVFALYLPSGSLFFVLAVASPSASQCAETAIKHNAPLVKVVDPKDVPPLIEHGVAFSEQGLGVHRRVISRPKDGAVGLDAGFNTWKAGLETPAFGYQIDELCYMHSGAIEMESDGVTVIYRAGNFLWRPARAVNRRAKVLEDAVETCAFGPARVDQWSHRLTSRERDEPWTGDPNKKPFVHLYDWHYITPVAGPGALDKGAISRRVMSPAKDGALYIDASYNTYPAGYEGGVSTASVEEICWIENGEMEMINDSPDAPKTIVKAGQFVYRPAGATTYKMKIIHDVGEPCFYGPARSS